MAEGDGRGPVSRHGQLRWSEDRELKESGFLIMRLGDRRDLKVFGGLVVHDGDCPHPQGPCDCPGGPLTIQPRPSRSAP